MEIRLEGTLDTLFRTEEECERYLIQCRWSNGFYCPGCDNDSFYEVKTIRILLQDEMTYSISTFANILGVNYRTARLLLDKLQFALNKRFIRTTTKLISQEEKVIVDDITRNANVSMDEQLMISPKSKIRKHTSMLGEFLFVSSKKVKYTAEDLLQRWLDAFLSVRLFPRSLRSFHMC